MTPKNKPPKTLGLIMDGNRRFARARGASIRKGHEAGYEKLKEFVRWAREEGVRTVIAYAFSTENWGRAKSEVAALMSLLERAVVERADELIREGVRISFVGERERFSARVKKGLADIEAKTRANDAFHLVIALSYGGRAEIAAAVEALVREKRAPTEENIGKLLWTAGIPDPDLIIRTGGEVRTSNFLPWQAVYSEWFFSPTLWPAFTKREFSAVLSEFSRRERRHGR